MNIYNRDIKIVGRNSQVNILLQHHIISALGEEGKRLGEEELVYPPTNITESGEVEGDFRFRFFYPMGVMSEAEGLDTSNHDTTFGGTRAGLYQNTFHIFDVPIEDDDVILDIGSNLGVFAIVIGKLYPKTKVHAIEANLTACKLIRMNAGLNGALNVNAHHIAVGDKNLDKINMWTENDYNTCAVKKESPSFTGNSHPNSAGKVRQITLESLLNTSLLDIDKVKYLKMDIEGAEIALFNQIFEKTPELLERIEYLNLEVHGDSEEADQVREKCQDYYGDKVFLSR